MSSLAGGDPSGRVAVCRPAVRRVVLEAAVAGRVVARGDDDAVGLVVVARGVVRNDRVAQGRGRHVVVELVDQHAHVVGGEHSKGRRLRWAGEPVGVLADEERAGDALARAVLDDRLRDRRDVRLGERRVERRPAVAARAEHHLLVGVRDIRNLAEIGLHEFVDVDEVVRLGGGSGARGHAPSLPVGTSRWEAFHQSLWIR